MSDPSTRERVIAVMKQLCPWRSVLDSHGPCRHFGSTGSCLSCMYSWTVVVDDVLKLAKHRRSAYEKEREKVKELTSERDELLVADRILVELSCLISEAADYCKRRKDDDDG